MLTDTFLLLKNKNRFIKELCVPKNQTTGIALSLSQASGVHKCASEPLLTLSSVLPL